MSFLQIYLYIRFETISYISYHSCLDNIDSLFKSSAIFLQIIIITYSFCFITV